MPCRRPGSRSNPTSVRDGAVRGVAADAAPDAMAGGARTVVADAARTVAAGAARGVLAGVVLAGWLGLAPVLLPVPARAAGVSLSETGSTLMLPLLQGWA